MIKGIIFFFNRYQSFLQVGLDFDNATSTTTELMK